MLHTPKTFFAALALLLAAGVSANISPNTYAETSASADGSATVTLHVLEADTTEQVPVNPTATADSDPEAYVDSDSSSEETTEIVQDEDLADSPDEAFTDDNSLDIIEDNDNTNNNNTSGSTSDDNSGTAAASGNGDGLSTPNTGAGTGSTASESDFNIFPIFAVVGGLLLLALIIKIIKDERVNRLYRGPRHSANMQLSSFAHLRFTHDHSRKLNIVRIARLTAVASVAGFACMFFLSNNTPDDTEAASSYPYTISIQNSANYDVYVKQGESVQASFAIKTTTDNPTGYTLTMTADQQTLNSSNASISATSTNASLANLADNTWGFSTNGTTYSAVPTTRSAGATLRKTSGASTSGNSSVVYFGFKAGEQLPAGEYTTTIHYSARTNLVAKKLKFANGNVATVTRVSDGSTLSNKSDIYIGEELKINSVADHAGITQSASVNGKAVSNGATVTVSGTTTVSTSDDSMHFIKNTYDTAKLADGVHSANGDAILIKSQGKVWLVDSGKPASVDGALNGKSVANYLKSLGISKIDYFLITHMHSDHYGGATYLKNQGYIDKNTTIYIRGCKATDSASHEAACNELMDQFATVNAQVIKLYAQESVRANLYSQGLDFGNFHIDFYNIEKDGDHIAYNTNRENLNSIGTKWTHKPSNKTAFLAADWEWGNEAAYASKIGKVDILKAGHHGSKTSNSYEFYSTLLPKTVIVTSQDFANTSGVPQRQEAAWAYVQQKGGSVYFTGSSTGDAVALSFDNSGYSVKKAKKKDVIAEANTADDPVSHDGGNTHFKWAGGVTNWYYPTNKTGAAPYDTTSVKHFVYVRQELSSTGNTILQVDRCVDGLMYRFASDHNDGVADNSKLTKCS